MCLLKNQIKMKKLNFEEIVLFENDNFILINKPPYVSSLPERLGVAKSILDLAKTYHQDAQLCHRLDKETSGILAIAKHAEAYKHLSIQFEKRRVHKTYHAIASGVHNFQNHLVELPLTITSKGLARIDFKVGKEASTIFNTEKAFKNHTLIVCKPISGRLHQIRIHLANCKAPLVADLAYGGKHLYLSQIKRKNFNLKWGENEQPLMKRVALHAYNLQFNDLNNQAIEVSAPYPKDMRALLRQLENHDF